MPPTHTDAADVDDAAAASTAADASTTTGDDPEPSNEGDRAHEWYEPPPAMEEDTPIPDPAFALLMEWVSAYRVNCRLCRTYNMMPNACLLFCGSICIPSIYVTVPAALW